LYQINGKVDAIVPTVGIIALAAQRLLPYLQQSYNGLVSIRGGQATLLELLSLLERPILEIADRIHAYKEIRPLKFNRTIEFKNVNFSYSTKFPVLVNFNLIIECGKKIGIKGRTGAGKSTILDLLMGLITPTSGKIEIDGFPLDGKDIVAWQKNISHVPQDIFLNDSTVKKNIAFGVLDHKIDFARVKLAASAARIDSDIESWENGYETVVGERGMKLSGGQRQRIGIARALYKGASLIIFDEATSALDAKTETEVMESIYQMDQLVTLVMVSHREVTLARCDSIIEL
jgi:ATP-binding cassette subfamily B protein